MVCTIQDDAGKTIALYDSNTNQIISAGQENSVDLDNFMSYGLKRIKISADNALTTSDINSVALNLEGENKTININVNTDSGTQNIPCTLEGLYVDENTGNIVYAIKDNEQNIIAIYDSNTNKIVSSGQDNSISLNESFAMSNNQYFKLTGTPLEIGIGMHITLDFNNDRITIEDAGYDLIPLYSENEKTYIYGVKNSNNEIIAMYDIQNGKFVSSSDNSTYLIQTSDNDYYSLIHAPLTISDINYVSLDFNNSFIEINSGIENTRYELVPYITPSGVRIPYLCVKNSSDEFFALYDIQNGKLFSSGENNFAHLAQAPDNNYYLLTGTPLETSSINYVVLDTQSQTININVNTETGTQNLECTLTALYTDDEGNIVYAIKDGAGKTIALYDSNTNQIISTGESNSVDLGDFMSYDGRYINMSTDNALSTSSINYVNLDIDNEKIYIDSSECTLTTLYTDDEGNIVYTIQDNTGKTIAIYDSNTNRIISSGQDNYVDLGNFAVYNGRYINISTDNALNTSNINSIYVDSTNNKIIINGTQPYDIEQMKDDSGNNIDMWAVKDSSGNIIAVYDNSGNSPTIFAGQDNFVNLDESFRLTDALLDTSNINYVVLNLEGVEKTININITNGDNTENLQCTLTTLYTDDEGNIVYAIKDSTEKTIALYDIQNGKLSSSGENNFTHLAQAPDNNYYPLTGTPLDTSTINSVALDTQNQTININVNTETGTQNISCTLTTLYTDDEGNIVYAIKDSTEKTIALYDIQNGKLSSSGENNFTHLAQAPDNNYYPLIGTPLDTSAINSVALDTQNQTIDINITVKGVGTPTLNCTLEELYTDDEENIVYAIKDSTGKTIAIYDSNTNQIISSGQDNSISLNESFAMSNNQYFKLTGTPLETSDINSVTLNTQNRTIDINVNTGTGTQNKICDLIALYNDKEGNTVYGIRDNERNFIAIYDSNTKQIISAGRDNSINLNNSFTLSNGVYTKNPQNTPEHTPATTDMNGPDDDAGGTPNRLLSSARPSITTSVTATPPNITPDMTIQDNNVVPNTELENLNVQSMSIVYDEFNLPVSINLNDNNYSLEFNPNTGKYYIANSTTSTLDTSTGTVTLSENNVFKYLSIDSNQYYILSANALDASEILTYNVSVDINSVMVTNINGTTTPYNLVGEENNIKYLVNPNNPTEKLAVFNVSTGEIIYAGQNYISLPQDMIMPDMAVLPSNNMINGNNNDNNIISDDTKQALSDLLRNNNNTIKGYIADGNLEGLKEYLNNEIQNTLPGAENQEIASLAQQVINDMQLEGTKTYEDFIEKLNQSLELNNLPTLDVGLEALENLTDSGTININVNGMNTGSMVTYILIASVATGLTSLAVNRINNKLQKKDLEKDLKKMNKRLEVRRRESLAKNSNGKKVR